MISWDAIGYGVALSAVAEYREVGRGGLPAACVTERCGLQVGGAVWWRTPHRMPGVDLSIDIHA